MTDRSVYAAQRLAARIAGVAYVVGILYVPVYLLTSASLSVPGDTVATIGCARRRLGRGMLGNRWCSTW